MKNKKYYLFQMKILHLNVLSFLLLFLMVAITSLISPDFLKNSIDVVFDSFPMFFVLMIIFMVIHEILHSVAYCIYGGKFKNIIYGVELEKGVFYCLCKQNINKLNILNSLFFPLFYIGIVTYILGLLFNLPILTWLSIFNISGCSGDIIMFIFLAKLNKNIEFTELDDSTSFAIYSDDDVSKLSHFGLEYKGNCDSVERKNLKKINISKFSYIFLAICLILSIALFIIK